ncbi:MAG: tetratricopeptide repeat protein [Filomicrobium sp.]
MTIARSLRVQALSALGGMVLLFGLFMPVDVPARSLDSVSYTRTLAGSYLAGRFARANNDTGRAANFYQNALRQDPESGVLLERAFLMEASEGNYLQAIRLAEEVVKRQPRHRMARLLLGLEAFKRRQYAKAQENFEAAGSGPIGELTSVITRAWVSQAEGKTLKALSSLTVRKQADWARYYLRYHRALISDLARRPRDAKRSFERVFQQDSKTLRTALAYARSLAHAGDYRTAKSVVRSHMRRARGDSHPLAKDLLNRLSRGNKVDLLVRNPNEGMAEVFYGLGEALTGEGGVSIGVLYLQMALYLEPRHPFALAALASALESMKRYDEAISVYNKIPSGSPLQMAIDIRKAFNLNELEKVDEAKALLERVAKQHPKSLKPYDALGNIMRTRKRYDEAIVYYTKAIDLIGGKPKATDWVYYYSRGTSYERVKKWSLAEVDLQRALKLDPAQPLALNYLGYSWIDQNINLRKGLQLIEKAVSLKPDDGYIVDSLGWAHYKLGNYAKATKYLERAVDLRPEDPVLNDHLGDAYWQVGRIREARFQWDQALSLKPEADLLKQINKKLAEGLPVKRRASAAHAVGGASTAQPVEAKQGTAGVPLPQRREPK